MAPPTINEAWEISAILVDETVDVFEVLHTSRGQLSDNFLAELKQLTVTVTLGVDKDITSWKIRRTRIKYWTLNKNKWIWNQPVNIKKQAAANSPKVTFCTCLMRSFLCNVNNTRVLICLSLLVTSHLCQIRDPARDSQVFPIAHIVIDLSLHIHYFIHLRLNLPVKMLFILDTHLESQHFFEISLLSLCVCLKVALATG